MKTRNTLLAVFTVAIFIQQVHAQDNFQIIYLNGKNEETVRRKDYIQCLVRNKNEKPSYFFGKIDSISKKGIWIKKHPLLEGSGGFVHFNKISNIHKVNLYQQSLLYASIFGVALGQASFHLDLPRPVEATLGFTAIYTALVVPIKYNKKKLLRNKINEAFILKYPITRTEFDSYYEME